MRLLTGLKICSLQSMPLIAPHKSHQQSVDAFAQYDHFKQLALNEASPVQPKT